jgi:hypothetical protein
MQFPEKKRVEYRNLVWERGYVTKILINLYSTVVNTLLYYYSTLYSTQYNYLYAFPILISVNRIISVNSIHQLTIVMGRNVFKLRQ